MEPVTHFLTGACLGRSGFNRKTAYATVSYTHLVDADFFFDDAVVGFFFGAGRVKGLGDDLAGSFHETGLGADKAAADEFGLTFNFPA